LNTSTAEIANTIEKDYGVVIHSIKIHLLIFTSSCFESHLYIVWK